MTKNSKFKKKNNNIVPMIFENFNVLHTNFIFDFVLQCIKLFMFLQVCCMSSKQSLECHFCLRIEKMIDYQQGSKGRLWIIDLLNLKLVKNSIVDCIVKELFFCFVMFRFPKSHGSMFFISLESPQWVWVHLRRFCYV